MKFVLSTIAWVESIAKKEIEKVWWKIEEVIDRLITFSWDESLMIKVNLWSRVWNKLYLLLSERENVKDFDTMFDEISSINWKKYFKSNNSIHIKSSSIRSDLYSARTIQSLWKKAVVKSLVWDGNIYKEDEKKQSVEILVLFIDNKMRVLLNTSGDALHKRWYRENSWEAPIKESLAAALILLSNWRFKENFYDFFCGSGTLAIEAIMIAKNIAPWLKRSFAFEKLWLLDREIVKKEREEAKKKEFSWKYNIFASDIDAEMISLAKENAKKAGLENDIVFEVKDFRDALSQELSWTMVSNPPYWERLKDENLKSIYNNIDKIFRVNEKLWGWIISSYMDFDSLVKKDFYKKRKLYNGWDMCYFWKKK